MAVTDKSDTFFRTENALGKMPPQYMHVVSYKEDNIYRSNRLLDKI